MRGPGRPGRKGAAASQGFLAPAPGELGCPTRHRRHEHSHRHAVPFTAAEGPKALAEAVCWCFGGAEWFLGVQQGWAGELA